MKRARNSKIKDYKNIRLSLFLSLFFVVLLIGMSVGYALFTQVINLNGTIGIKNQGTFKITNVMKVESSNSSEDIPTWTDDSIDFNLKFIRNTTNPVYSATYDITVKNDTFFERLISSFNFTFDTINDEGDEMGTLDYEILNFDQDDVVPSLTEKTYRIVISFTPSVDEEIYDIPGGGDIDSSLKDSGELTLNAINPTSGSIKDGTRQRVTISLTSTYQSSKSFTINVNSDKVIAVDSNGNALSNFNIDANSEGQEFTFYLQAKADALFPDDTYTTGLSLISTGIPTLRLGNITLEVNKHEEYVDTTPPVISHVTAVQSNEVGVVDLSWIGTDDYSGIKDYTVLVIKGNNIVRTISNVTDTSISINNLSEGATSSNYSFKVYGTDNEGNTASNSDINNASTSSGYCSMSEAGTYQWVYSITHNLNNLSFSGENTANIGTNYTCTLRANTGYSLPNNITVRMGNRNLTSGTDYTYSANNGRITINNVSGNITITANGTRNAICLVEGTKVLMANNRYKNIEDINYDDLMYVWGHDTGRLEAEYPIWIEKVSTVNEYLKTTFSDGTTLSTSGDHGVYNYDLGMFVSVLDRDNYHVGSTVAKIKNGKINKVKITKLETVKKKVKLYHIISNRYFNIIGNDVLTTDRTLMISNLYGFTNNITWPKVRNDFISNENNLYKYEEFSFMPYYLFKGLRIPEGKFLVDNKFISYEEFILYLMIYPANKDYYRAVEVDKNNNRLWMVTTSFDMVNDKNKDRYKVKEGSIYTLPNKRNVKCFRSSIDKKCYKANDKVKIYSGTHFSVEY